MTRSVFRSLFASLRRKSVPSGTPTKRPCADKGPGFDQLERRCLLVAGTFAFQVAASSPTEPTAAHLVTVDLTTDAALGLGDTMSVDVSVGAGTATGGGGDYTFAPITVTFTDADVTAAGTFSKDVTVTLINDTLVEGDETVRLDLSNPVASNVGDTAALGATTQHTVTIDDNDTASISIAAATTVTEQGGAQNIVVTLTTSDGGAGTATLASALTVDVTDTGGGTATGAGTDYAALGTQTLTFAAGSGDATTQNATITPTNDTLVEGNETVNVGLGNLSSTLNGQASLGTTAGVVTIDDNDTASISIAAATSVVEGGGAQNIVVTLSTSNGAGGTATLGAGITLTADVVDAGTGSATSVTDYAAFGTQTVTFSPGAGNGATQNVSITPVADGLADSNETVNLTLQNLNTTLNGQVSLGTTSGVVTILDEMDFGDAPDPLAATAGQYPTLLANDGARHVLSSGLTLGATVDGEGDGQPNATATGDGADEDGVVLPATIIARLGVTATVTASGAGKLDAWIDYDRDGIFEAAEQIATNLTVAAGANTLSFTVPASASAGTSFARFRLSSAGGLSPTGQAADGEVEDYAVQIAVRATCSAAVVSDPADPGQSVLVIVGSSSSDSITIKPKKHSSGTPVKSKGGCRLDTSFTTSGFNRLVIFAGGGDDKVDVSKFAKRASLFGEAGNDDLKGGSAENILVGGDGNDNLQGGDNRDVIISGIGGDKLTGKDSDDLLAAGRSDHDTNDAALMSIMDEWSRTDAVYATRVNHLLGTAAGGLNLNFLLNDQTVDDDNVQDSLKGQANSDWFLANVAGINAHDMIDAVTGEVVTDLIP